MAERGQTTPLESEIEATIQAGMAENLLSGGGLAASPGSVELTFDVSVVLELFSYDAGTDSGVIYSLPNEVTDPRINISRIVVSPFGVASPLGTFTFTRRAGS
jgi:hypothetical protein